MKVKVSDVAKFKTTLITICKMADDLSKHTSEQCVQLFTLNSSLIAKATRASRYVASLSIPVEVLQEGSLFIHAKELESLLKPLDIRTPSLDLYSTKSSLTLNLYSLGKRSKSIYPDIESFPPTGLTQPWQWTKILTSPHLTNTLKDIKSFVSNTETIWLQGFIEDNKGFLQLSCKGVNSGYLKKEIEDEDLREEFSFYIKPDIASLLCSIDTGLGVNLYSSPTSNTFKLESGNNNIIFASINTFNTDLSSMVTLMSSEQVPTSSLITCNYMELLSAINWQGADDEAGDLTLKTEEGYLTIGNQFSTEPAKLQILSSGGDQWKEVKFKTETLKRIVASVEAPNSCIQLSTKIKSIQTPDETIDFIWLILTPVTKYGGGFPTGLISAARLISP